MKDSSFSTITPLQSHLNAPLELLVQYGNGQLYPKRQYTKYQTIDKLAIEKYKGSGKGISFNDLIQSVLHDIKGKHKTRLNASGKRKFFSHLKTIIPTILPVLSEV
jgi:hypothetical protein